MAEISASKAETTIMSNAGLVDGPEQPQIRGIVHFGFVVLALFAALAFGWGGTAPLESAAIAAGQIGLDTNRKAVQHLEGGMVSKLLIRERDAVKAGQPLILLDDTQPRTRIANLEAQITADERQLRLIVQEEEILAGLAKKGLVQLPRLLQISRRRAELEGSIARYKSELAAAKEILARTTIRAPIEGIVVGLQVHTLGGVIAAGAVLMEIVPANDPLVAEARLDPNDIDVVHKGLTAYVRLTPYNYRNRAPVKGEVVWVSADRMTDTRSGQTFYLARIKLDPLPAMIDPSTTVLYPGMPIEAIIVTGKRSALEYMVGPIIKSFNRAFRED